MLNKSVLTNWLFSSSFSRCSLIRLCDNFLHVSLNCCILSVICIMAGLSLASLARQDSINGFHALLLSDNLSKCCWRLSISDSTVLFLTFFGSTCILSDALGHSWFKVCKIIQQRKTHQLVDHKLDEFWNFQVAWNRDFQRLPY